MDDFDIELKISALDQLEDLLSELLDLLREYIDGGIIMDKIDAIFRIVHSIKGNSKACDFEELSKVSHYFEDLLLKVKQEQYVFTKEILDLSLDYCDEVSKSKEETRKDLDFKPDFSYLIERLESYEPQEENEEVTYEESTQSSPPPTVEEEQKLTDDIKLTKVLLAVDDESLKSLLCNQINAYFPISIKDVSDEEEASKACIDFQYDLIICDFQIPIINGQAFVNTLRENLSLNQHTPVIFLTDQNSSLIPNEEIWDDVFIMKKPIEKSKLLYYVRCALEIKYQKTLAS